jgi:uncharacterized protein YkwD
LKIVAEMNLEHTTTLGRYWKQGGAAAIAGLLLGSCAIVPFDFPVPMLLHPLVQQKLPRLSSQSTSTAQMERQVQQQINTIRQQHGLTQLRYNEKLAQVARKYSQQMAVENFFSHTSPTGDTMVQRVHTAGIVYLMLGENLFKGTNLSQPSAIAVQGWMGSPGHRRNILESEYRETGIGVWRRGNTYYFTQLFMRSVW